MTGERILLKARQSRIAALECLEGSRTSRRLSVKMAEFRTRLIRDEFALEEKFFKAFEERRMAA